mgnify:CR=1 FL=1
MIQGLGEAMLLTWAQLGVVIEDIKETTELLNVYISVPRSSYHKNCEDEEMSGMFLAKRFKESFIDMGVKRVVVKAKVREQDWTKELSKSAVIRARQELYGSQW